MKSILAIIGLGILVYSNTFLCSFHFDDDAYIVHNYAIRNIHHLQDIWNVCPCRFVTFLSIALNYHFRQLHLFGYHLVNLIVHAGSACLVWWLILLTFSTPAVKEEKITQHAQAIALLAALIFVSHPVQTEAVTYIWQRAASLCAFFYLASLCFYIKARLLDVKHGTYAKATSNDLPLGPGMPYYMASLIIAVIAMFTKENAITLPLMVLLYELCFFKSKKDQSWYQLFPFLIILFIIPKTMMLTKSTRFGELQMITGGPGGISPLDYLMTQFRVMVTYIRLLVVPINLNLDYDYPVYKNFLAIPVITSFAFLAAILYFAKCMFAQYRLIAFSIFWFFLTLLPESSILPQTDVIFEHRLYLPMVGYCIFLTSGAYYVCVSLRGALFSDEAIFKRTTKCIVIILSLVIALNSFLTYQRNKIWKNEITLWNDVIQKSPHKARPYINRGWAYYNQGNFTSSLSDYNKAIAISPEFIYSYDDIGLIEARQGNFLDAISEYNKAININPYYPQVYYHRADAFLKLGNYSQAMSDYNKVMELDPEYPDAYNDPANLRNSLDKLPQNMVYIDHHDRP